MKALDSAKSIQHGEEIPFEKCLLKEPTGAFLQDAAGIAKRQIVKDAVEEAEDAFTKFYMQEAEKAKVQESLKHIQHGGEIPFENYPLQKPTDSFLHDEEGLQELNGMPK